MHFSASKVFEKGSKFSPEAHQINYGSIQLMRALAAFGVLIFHIDESQFVGAAGVDVFFVISGFIMGKIALNDSPAPFLIKRVIRIAPLYWVITIGMCIASFVPGLFSTFTFSLERLVMSLLFIPHYNPEDGIYPLINAGWTLSFEMFFYLVFALGLYLRRPIVLTAIVMMALVFTGWLTGWTQDKTNTHAILAFFTRPIILEFVAGLVLSKVYMRLPKHLAPIFIIISLCLFAHSQYSGFYSEDVRLLYWGLPALGLVWGALVCERVYGWPRFLRPLERMGDASYSLYLTHGIIVALVYKLLGKSLPVNVLIVLASIGVAFACYYGFEKPVTTALKNLYARTRLRAA